MKATTPVFKVSVSLAGAFLVWGATAPDHLAKVTGAVQQFLLNSFGWFYLLVVVGMVISALYLAFSRYGEIPLGPDGAQPEFRLVTWFAMLFCAGMGIGLVFWGVAEPSSHYYDPPMGPGETPEAASLALQYSFFHWGFHPWAIYAMVGLCLAYFQFRKQSPGLISHSCRPLLGNRVHESPRGNPRCVTDSTISEIPRGSAVGPAWILIDPRSNGVTGALQPADAPWRVGRQ